VNKRYLFKGVSKITNEWVYGNLVIDEDGECIIVRTENINEVNVNGKYDFNKPTLLATIVYNDSVSQYIGIDDSKGNKIFENDIVTYTDCYTYPSESGCDYEEFKNEGVVEFTTDEYPHYYITNSESTCIEDIFNSNVIVISNKFNLNK